jgi:hypothetical protein
MAPKLTPDNLVIPDTYIADLDRNSLDPSIFPLSHHGGQLSMDTTRRRYTPASPYPSPYSNERITTDIRVNTEIDFRDRKQLKFNPDSDAKDVWESKPLLGGESLDGETITSLIKATQSIIAEKAKVNDISFPGSDVEIITLGTGSAVPNKYRNGTFFSLTQCNSI